MNQGPEQAMHREAEQKHHTDLTIFTGKEWLSFKDKEEGRQLSWNDMELVLSNSLLGL